MERTVLSIEGMSCRHCARAVAGALQGVEGVVVERVEVGSAEVEYDPGLAGAERIATAIREAGYQVVGTGRGS